jgi:hypothetical protein
MSHHHTSHNYRQTDASTTNNAAPTECPACGEFREPVTMEAQA